MSLYRCNFPGVQLQGLMFHDILCRRQLFAIMNGHVAGIGLATIRMFRAIYL